MRELGDLAPIRSTLLEITERERAALAVKDGRIAAVLSEVRESLEGAIADAMRPPEDGLTPEEYAHRNDLTRWAVYKQLQRGEIPGAQKVGGHWKLPAA